MSNLLSDAEKQEFSSALVDLHDTFKRKIVIYKTPTVTNIVTSGDYNYVFDDTQENTTTTITPVSGEYFARVFQTSDIGNLEKGQLLPNTNILAGKTYLRLKLDEEAYRFIIDSQKFFIDGFSYNRISDESPHGLFDLQFYTVWFRRD
jgi:hypothetical protein